MSTALRQAVVALHEADATIQSTTGRSDRNMNIWGIELDSDKTPYPIGEYRIISNVPDHGVNGHRRIRLEITWWSKSDDPYSELGTLMDRSEALITHANLKAQGVDAAVSPNDERRDGEAGNGLRSLQNDFIIELQE